MKYILFAVGILFSFQTLAVDTKNLPLVYDPQTKKYFIGGTSKFVLKQGEENALVDRIEISIDGGDYRPYGEAIVFKEEGKHTLKFKAVSSINNWSPVQFVEVFVDLTAPTSEAKFVEDKFFKNDKNQIFVALNSSVSIMAQDNLSGTASIEYSLDGKSFTPATKPIKFEKPGKQTISYRSVDRVGNSEQIKTIEVFVDTAMPISKLQLQGAAKPAILKGLTYVSDSVAFELTATDDSSQVKQIWVSIDGKPATPYIKPLYFLQEGPHSLKYFAVDNVGNKEDEKTLSFYAVSQPPKSQAKAIGKVVNTGGINYTKSDFKLILEATDNAVGLERIEYRVDQNPQFKTYLEPIRFDTPGLHSVSYQSVDRSGNVEPAKTFSLFITEVAPETTLTTAQPLVVKNGVSYSPAPNVITLNVGNSSVGIHQTVVSLNDAPFELYKGPITLEADRKIHKIAYKSIDKLGNEELPKTASFHMINAIPIVDLFISNGQSSEEKVRVDYLEEADKTVPARVPATKPPKTPTSAR